MLEGLEKKGRRCTCVGVLVADLAGAERAVDDGRQAGVEVLRAVEELQVAGRGEVLVRADDGIFAVGGALQPSRALTAGPRGDFSDGDQLEAIEWGLDNRAIPQGLRAQRRTDGRIQPLQETLD